VEHILAANGSCNENILQRKKEKRIGELKSNISYCPE